MCNAAEINMRVRPTETWQGQYTVVLVGEPAVRQMIYTYASETSPTPTSE